MTLFSKKLMVKAAFSAALVLGLVNCADEPVKIKEVVEAIPDVVQPAVDHVVPEVIYFDFDKSQIRRSTSVSWKHLPSTCGGTMRLCKSKVTVMSAVRSSTILLLARGEPQSVKNYLMQLGVDGARVTTISFGEEKPAVPEHNEFAWSKNRRAMFRTANN